jgi:hypothetical protein
MQQAGGLHDSSDSTQWRNSFPVADDVQHHLLCAPLTIQSPDTKPGKNLHPFASAFARRMSADKQRDCVSHNNSRQISFSRASYLCWSFAIIFRTFYFSISKSLLAWENAFKTLKRSYSCYSYITSCIYARPEEPSADILSKYIHIYLNMPVPTSL